MEPLQKRVTNCLVALVVACMLWSTAGIFTPASTAGTYSTVLVADSGGAAIETELVKIPTPLPTSNQYDEVYAAHAFEEVSKVEVAMTLTSFEDVIEEPTLDKTKPIYEVYKDSYHVDVPAELQWLVRDIATEYGFNEKILFGLILAESTFNPNCVGDNERSFGLCQINRYWLTSDPIAPYRLTEDYKERNLLNPKHNLLTLVEIWRYAIDVYKIDISTEQGMKDLLYWHNTGKYRNNVQWRYSNKIFAYAEELIPIE